MGYAVLELTNGTDVVKLISSGGTGFHLKNWEPGIATMKGGGTWRSSAMGDGRSLILSQWDNVFESFEFDISGFTQTDIITDIQRLRALINQARNYWPPRSTVGPVWIKAQADCEDNPRYAYVYNGETPNDNNPHGDGFGGQNPMFTDWLLVVERGHWQSEEPGTEASLEISGTINSFAYSDELLINSGFETAGGGGADVFANWTESAGDGAIARATGAGNFFLGAASCQLTSGVSINTYVQQNFVSVPGVKYSLVVYYRNVTSNVSSPRIQIMNLTAATDIVPVTVLRNTLDTVEWRRHQITFIAPAGCISVGVRLYCTSSAGRVVQLDNIGVTTMTPAIFGRGTTDLNEVLVSNKTSYAQITQIYRYDASAGTFSSNLAGAAVPFDLFPNPVAAGDIIYFGIADGVQYSGPFSNIVFDIHQAAAGTLNAVLEYGTAAGFSGIPNQYIDTTALTGLSMPSIDPTDIFSVEGVGYLGYEVGTNHVRSTVNGVYGWWIRVRVVAIAAGAPRPTQVNRAIYTANQPAVTLGSAQARGEIDGLLRIKSFSGVPNTATTSVRYLLTSRSASRGADFNPYINLSPFMLPDGISVAFSSPVVLDTYGRSPAGYFLKFLTALAASSSNIQIDIANPLCNSYYGAFRVFVRGMLASGGACSVSLGQVVAGTSVTPGATGTFEDVGILEMVDLGKITLPWMDIGDRQISSVSIQLNVSTAAGPATLNLYDMLLLPVDENSMEIVFPSYAPNILNYMDLDSTKPKTSISAVSASSGSGFISSIANVIGVGRAQFRENEQQYFYMTALGNSSLETSIPKVHDLFAPQLTAVCRYLSMRGDK